MKTILNFEAPQDLSVGTIRIQNNEQSIVDWIATPDNRAFSTEDISPGIYWVDVTPAGLSSQSVFFNVEEGKTNTVTLPSFSALLSSGSNTSFFNSDKQQTETTVPPWFTSDAAPLPSYAEWSSFGTAPASDMIKTFPVDVSPDKRRISLGLSEEQRGRETFNTFRGESKIEMFVGRLELQIPDDSKRDHRLGHRVRLTATIEKVRIERCLLPLYQGGTQIMVVASPFAPEDLELSITPVDPRLRALVRSLDAGTSAEVQAVRDDIIHKHDFSALSKDPWALMLIGLLSIRFSELFSLKDDVWLRLLKEHADWAFDTHVIIASKYLSAAQGKCLQQQHDAVSQAIESLAKAQIAGSPYYRYTNQLFAELSSGIANYIKTNVDSITPAIVRTFERLNTRWHRELPLQRGFGSTFSWLARDLNILKTQKVLTPNRTPSGRLSAHNTLVIFQGEISAGKITLLRADQKSVNTSPPSARDNLLEADFAFPRQLFSEDSPELPAFSRPVTFPDDPNKERFGGQVENNGFILKVEFEETKSRDWETIILTVQAQRATNIGIGDFAWFSLHPTFSPSLIKVAFRGRRAQLRLQAWGGFTAGVWIPKSNVELECDLSSLAMAPGIIKLR
ncbi:pYEATS domain-containing protein [Citrobacter braakii]|uniref:pYEATS domain-containing protein n=1 Tax=Citrobacter braakii TaxID=57706 RepID=UPI00397BDFE9